MTDLLLPGEAICVECRNCGFAGAYETRTARTVESMVEQIYCPSCGVPRQMELQGPALFNFEQTRQLVAWRRGLTDE